MKNKKLLFGVCLSLLVGAAALTTASALSATEPQDDLLRANIEALTSGEGGSLGYYTAQCPVSYVLISECKVVCKNCRTEHYPTPRVYSSNATNIEGYCDYCKYKW